MKTVGVIPARFASTRFPAKVLANLAGKPVIQHVWEKAKQCKGLDEVLIACDHPDVLKAAQAFGAKTVMTDPNHASGSDRIAEAVKNIACDVVVNIQGDEPFIDPHVIDAVVALFKDPAVQMGTAIKVLAGDAELADPNVVKCVVDAQGYALYFSRAPIPGYKHIGLYAYRKDFLLQYTKWPKSKLETAERLEQLRVLEQGGKIKTIVTQYESIAIDTPQDLKKAEEWLKQSK